MLGNVSVLYAGVRFGATAGELQLLPCDLSASTDLSDFPELSILQHPLDS